MFKVSGSKTEASDFIKIISHKVQCKDMADPSFSQYDCHKSKGLGKSRLVVKDGETAAS